MFNRFERMVAFRYLLSRRKEGFISVIALFSLIGIILGVGTLIVVMSVMNGFHKELLTRVLGVNAHLVVNKYGRPIEDYKDVKELIEAIDGVAFAAPVVEGQVMVTADGMSTGALVKAISPEDLAKKHLIATNIKSGSMADFKDDGVIVGARLAEMMHMSVGDPITLIAPHLTVTVIGAIPRIKDYHVAGIFDVGMYEYDSTYIFMPLESGQLYLRYPNAASSIEVMVKDPEKVDQVAADIDAATNHSLIITDWEKINAQFFNSLKVERTVMFLILTLIILVAAFNIISSMIMLVSDKRKAIAILRTMGASRGAILRIFFLCGSSIGVIGTAIGCALGVAFAYKIETIRHWLETLIKRDLFSAEVYYLTKLPVDLQFNDVIGVVIMALALSFLATIYPAWKAARVSPAEGVRYE
jgi:lipoprotein-releasing system permease protein